MYKLKVNSMDLDAMRITFLKYLVRHRSDVKKFRILYLRIHSGFACRELDWTIGVEKTLTLFLHLGKKSNTNKRFRKPAAETKTSEHSPFLFD